MVPAKTASRCGSAVHGVPAGDAVVRVGLSAWYGPARLTLTVTVVPSVARKVTLIGRRLAAAGPLSPLGATGVAWVAAGGDLGVMRTVRRLAHRMGSSWSDAVW